MAQGDVGVRGLVPRLRRLEQLEHYRPDEEVRPFSATHQEIQAGWTTDVYFIRTLEILEGLGLAETPVEAEVFARGEGILAGVEEVRRLLAPLEVEVEALGEGEPFQPQEPVLRIRGPYNRFGPYETAVLGILASSSGWATAARRCKEAAGEKLMICFGARHVHPAVAPVMERAALIGGADGTSCVLAALLSGRKPSGTIPHAAVLIAGDTVEVARAYDRFMPPDAPRIILVDTFHDEAEEALRVAEALGERLQGVRLDTPDERGGVTPALVREVRARLDQAGHRHVRIFVSGGLTPEKIAQLAAAGADAFGVGSYIAGASPIDMTMDLKVVAGRPVAKRGRIPGLRPSERLRRILP